MRVKINTTYTKGFLVFLGLVVAAAPVQVIAQSQQAEENITLTPVSKRLDVDAGETINDKFTILNRGTTSYDFIVYARPYAVKDSSYSPDYDSDAANADAYQWVQFEQTKYPLAPGEQVDVPFTMRVPENATPGGHYGILFAETQSQSDDGFAIARNKRVGAIMYVTVKGTFDISGSIGSVNIPTFQVKPPLRVESSVRNTGNDDFEADVAMRVSDIFGREKFVLESPSTVLPETTRDITVEWEDAPWIGIYRVETTTTILAATEDESSVSETGLVLVAPRWFYFVLSLLLIGGIAYVVIRTRNQRK